MKDNYSGRKEGTYYACTTQVDALRRTQRLIDMQRELSNQNDRHVSLGDIAQYHDDSPIVISRRHLRD